MEITLSPWLWPLCPELSRSPISASGFCPRLASSPSTGAMRPLDNLAARCGGGQRAAMIAEYQIIHTAWCAVKHETKTCFLHHFSPANYMYCFMNLFLFLRTRWTHASMRTEYKEGRSRIRPFYSLQAWLPPWFGGSCDSLAYIELLYAIAQYNLFPATSAARIGKGVRCISLTSSSTVSHVNKSQCPALGDVGWCGGFLPL